MTKNVSIEYAHIYTNNKIAEEQKLSIKVLGEIKSELERSKRNFSLVVLVDDYSFPDPSFSYDNFSKWLGTQGYTPDLIFRESQLILLCDQVLSLLVDHHLHDEIRDYMKSKKYPCSLFIAAWYLLRLGYLHHDSFNQNLYAKKLINILPISFKPFEDKGLEIIKSTKFSDAANQIEYRFLPGREIE